MWYFNDIFVHEKGYTLHDAVVLQLIHQNRGERKEDSIAMYITDEMLDKFAEEKLVQHVNKKKKDDSDFSTLRLTKKGTELLNLFGTPKMTSGDEQMFEYLSSMYLKSEDKERVVGNKKKTMEYCSIFRQKMSLSLYEMYWLCYLFLDEHKFTKRLEYIFFNSNKHRYGSFEAHFDDGSLFQFLDENRGRVEQFWKIKIKSE